MLDVMSINHLNQPIDAHAHTHTYLDPLFLVKHQHVGAVQQPSLPVGIGAQEGGGLFWSQ